MGAGEAFCAGCPGETRGKGKEDTGPGNVEVLGDENKNGARGARGQGTGGRGERPMEEEGGQLGGGGVQTHDSVHLHCCILKKLKSCNKNIEIMNFWRRQNSISVVFLLKMHNLIPVMRKGETENLH